MDTCIAIQPNTPFIAANRARAGRIRCPMQHYALSHAVLDRLIERVYHRIAFHQLQRHHSTTCFAWRILQLLAVADMFMCVSCRSYIRWIYPYQLKHIR